MKKSFQSWLGCLLIAFIVTACGPAPTPAPTPEPTILRFAYAGHATDYQRLADEFHEQYPDVTIELVPVSLRAQVGGFDFLLEQFEESDVVRMKTTFVGPEQLDAILPLDDFIADSEDFPRQDFFPGSLEALQHEKRQMGAPAGLDPVVMFYENIRFKVASATPPDPDYTLEDFLASAGKINNQGASLESGSYSYGFCTTPLSDDPVFFAYLFDGGLFDSISAPTQPELNSTANVEAIQWYATLWSEHALAPKVTDYSFQTYQQVGATSCGYWMNWLDMFGFGEGLAVQPRVLPLPRVDESSGAALSSPAFLDGYFITKYSPNPEAAWKWINFLLERQEASLKLIPPLTWQIESDEYAQRVSPDVLAVAQRLPSNMPFLSLDVFNDPRSSLIQNVFSNAVRDVVEGKAEPQAALDEAQAKAEEIFNSPATQDARP